MGVMGLVILSVTSFIDQSTSAIRQARHSNAEARAMQLCESGYQHLMHVHYGNFAASQSLTTIDSAFFGASPTSPRGTVAGMMDDVGNYSTGVIGIVTPPSQQNARIVTIRTVGWIDQDKSGTLNSGDPQKTIDYVVKIELARSQVFDYARFINNYSWVKGFNRWNMIVNGDWRVNGDFDILNGELTLNGSLYAAPNTDLDPPSAGTISSYPWKDDNWNYNSKVTGASYGSRMRQQYDPAIHGAYGTPEFERWRDLLFFTEATVVNGRTFGAVLGDSNGVKGRITQWDRVSHRVLDTASTSKIEMPDLRDFGSPTDPANEAGQQFAKSKAWRNEKATFLDGTPNPNYSGSPTSANEFLSPGVPNPNYSGAFVDVWDTTTNQYRRVSSNGVVPNSALLVGTSSHPIRVHGPVTIEGDVAIAGVVEGQGTLYTTRTVHILADVTYKNAPDFRGNNIDAIEAQGERADALGLCARGSVMVGKSTDFDPDTINHMKPPFTKARKLPDGTILPAFDGSDLDGYGIRKYESLLQHDPATAATYAALAANGVSRIDGVVYTNNMFGGEVGWDYNGFTVNGSVIAKDEAITAWSHPVIMNYDQRIRDRGTGGPLIDIELPRGPRFSKRLWQDRGFRITP